MRETLASSGRLNEAGEMNPLVEASASRKLAQRRARVIREIYLDGWREV